MRLILNFFQIKTVRSAWVFLVGSVVMLVFGAYQALIPQAYPPGYPIYAFLAFWFLVLGIYIAIASWALFSVKGREYLISQEKIPIKGHRTILWFFKFLFACYAVAFASIMLLGILLLPFYGFAVLDDMLSQNVGMYILIIGLFWAPLIYKKLK